MKPKFGICFDGVYEKVDLRESIDLAVRAEDLGFDSFWVADHLTWSHGCAAECWTVLSALSTITKKLRLGTLVLCNLFRQPSLLAKMASTLDIVSKGRLEFGIGAGWKEDECRMYGITFPAPNERLARLEESVQMIRSLWTQESVNFRGRFYSLDGAVLEPKPVQKPHPPIWIGAKGEKFALRIVAEHADGYNHGPCSIEEYVRKCQVIEHFCRARGRDPAEIKLSYAARIFLTRNEAAASASERSTNDRLAGSSAIVADKLSEFVRIGVEHFQIIFDDLPSTAGMETFMDEVVPLL